MSPVGLVGVSGGLEDLGVAVGVSELVLRDLAKGVARTDQVGGAAPPGRVRGAVRGGKGERGAGVYPPLGAVGAGVEVGDLVPARSIAELGVGDRPQGLTRGDGVRAGGRRTLGGSPAAALTSCTPWRCGTRLLRHRHSPVGQEMPVEDPVDPRN